MIRPPLSSDAATAAQIVLAIILLGLSFGIAGQSFGSPIQTSTCSRGAP